MIVYLLIASNIAVFFIFIFYIFKTSSKRQENTKLKEELEMVREKLKEIDQDKREFIDIVTHELNTPLATTSGYLSMIIELPEGEVKPSVLELLKKSFEATKRMSKIVEDLINSSKTIGEERTQAIELEAIIDKVLTDFQREAKEKNIDLNFEIPPKFPLPLVAADPLSTKIILANLVDNALKFTKTGRIIIETEEQKNEMLVKVKDTGLGIKKEDQKRIFEKFFQADSSRTREAGGTGVGLFIVKNLVERQGGRVWVESKENDGSTFYFTIPKAPSS